jgi:nucleoporin NDC1
MAPTTVRRAPYKDFLQPGLHRRFSLTAAVLLVIAYIQAIYFGGYHGWFWTFFPIGPVGIRTVPLYLCGLLVIVLRIAQYHVGVRTSNSAFENFTQNVFKLQTLEALVTYVFSGWLFSQMWIWCSSAEKGLNWITYFSGDRARLNEKPLFFTWHFIILGCMQAFLHLFYDFDRLSLGFVKAKETGKGSDSTVQLKQFLMGSSPPIFIRSLTQSAAAVVLSVLIYPTFMRGFVWRTTLVFLRPFYNLPKTNMLPSTWPFNAWVLWQCAWVGFLLLIVWSVGNEAFSTFLVREPLKNGQPLTSESKDPNGSLLNGLKSRKLPIRVSSEPLKRWLLVALTSVSALPCGS